MVRTRLLPDSVPSQRWRTSVCGRRRKSSACRACLAIAVELAFEAAQALIVSADVAENLRGQFTLRIEALGLFLKVDALQIQRTDTLNHFGIGLACHPAEGLARWAVRKHTRGSSFVMREIRLTVLARSGVSEGTTKAEST